MAACAALLSLATAATASEPIVAEFTTGDTIMALSTADIREAAPVSGSQGPGLSFEMTEAAGARFAAFTAAAVGQSMSLHVCGDLLIEAVIRAPLDGRAMIGLEGLEAATYYARVLNGEEPC